MLHYHNRSTIQSGKLKNRATQVQVNETDSINRNFRDALIAPVIGLFQGIRFFYLANRESLAAFRSLSRPILCEVRKNVMFSTKEITGICIQKEHKKTYSFFEKVWLFFYFS